MMDTLIWLANFPVRNGYAMVFVAGFSMMGLIALAFRRPAGRDRLAAVRAREGLVETDGGDSLRRVGGHLRAWAFRLLFAIVAAGGVLGVLGLCNVPVTSAYIHANGTEATATVEGNWVSFTASDGRRYTLENPFFASAAYPDANASVGWGGAPVTVRYLPGHPQAFVIDTESLPRP
ncbi:hypothetical protein J2Y69_003439 [Microbacterium resistens]|uniref:DUF3592 domain-containing protein n=1 Tax=Microbacterium resistens TaxID=156977 RepID=A0ABU1SGT4_9MICO|nr:hypothetical protein [Microbacterium resistens]MDR6868815.1 hypothetical protein [Microbacterium resistens]